MCLAGCTGASLETNPTARRGAGLSGHAARRPVGQLSRHSASRDPYRWLEARGRTGDQAVDRSAERAVAAVSGSRFPRASRSSKRLTELWNYERYDIPVQRGGRYFYTRNDGLQNQSVLYVADGAGCEAARAARSEHVQQGCDDRAERVRAEPRRQAARLQSFRWRHRLALLALSRRRHGQGPARRAALHQVRSGRVDAGFALHVLRALSAARRRRGRRHAAARESIGTSSAGAGTPISRSTRSRIIRPAIRTCRSPTTAAIW